MSLPELYLIGAPKAGTTSIARWLSSHPQVYWSVPKEPFFWASDYPRMRAHYGFDTVEAYGALYSSPEAEAADIRGDGSTTYLYSTRAVPDILHLVPEAKFVVCLRNPIDLLVSYHRTQVVALNENEPDFGRSWRRSLAGQLPDTDPLDPKLLDYPRVGKLGEAVGRLLATAPPEHVHGIVFDDLSTEPEEVWCSLADFVGIDPEPLPEFVAHNASNKFFRSLALRRLTHRPPRVLEPGVRRLRQWSRTTDVRSVAALKRRMWQEEERPVAAPADRQAVADYLRDDVARLSQLFDRDLSGWTA